MNYQARIDAAIEDVKRREYHYEPQRKLDLLALLKVRDSLRVPCPRCRARVNEPCDWQVTTTLHASHAPRLRKVGH